MAEPVGPEIVGSGQLHVHTLSPAGLPGHDVKFYERQEHLIDTVAGFLSAGFRAGQPAIVIATEPHRRALRQRGADMGVDLDELALGGEYIELDASQTLSAFMEGPRPNRELFQATIGNVIEKLVNARTYLVVRAFGEMVDVLLKEGNVEGALELEDLWNELAAKHSFSLLCGYAMGKVFREAHAESFRRICDKHLRVVP